MKPRYSPAQLAAMARAGNAYRCRDGCVVPLADQSDITSAIALAKIRYGTPADEPGLRAAIGRRAVALGVADLVPPAWDAGSSGQGTQGRGSAVQGAPGAGTSGGMGKVTELVSFTPVRVDGVRSPANGAPILLAKSAGSAAGAARAFPGVAGRVIKSDGARRYTLTVAYPALRPDVGTASDGYRDFASKQAVEDAAWSYLAESRQVGLWHADGVTGAGTVVESHIHRAPKWVLKAADGSKYTVRKGDWLLGVIWNPQTWRLIQEGHVRGVSPQGTAQRRVPPDEAVAGLRKADEYERLAGLFSDPATQEGYRQMAAAGRPGPGREQLLAKAAGYERTAGLFSDIATQEGYLEMARRARREAGAA